jgi:hypothetical protein
MKECEIDRHVACMETKNLKGRNNSGDLGIDWVIILKWILEKRVMR